MSRFSLQIGININRFGLKVRKRVKILMEVRFENGYLKITSFRPGIASRFIELGGSPTLKVRRITLRVLFPFIFLRIISVFPLVDKDIHIS